MTAAPLPSRSVRTRLSEQLLADLSKTPVACPPSRTVLCAVGILLHDYSQAVRKALLVDSTSVSHGSVAWSKGGVTAPAKRIAARSLLD